MLNIIYPWILNSFFYLWQCVQNAKTAPLFINIKWAFIFQIELLMSFTSLSFLMSFTFLSDW